MALSIMKSLPGVELPSAHNLNYWQFGDYLAIGAGAHGKVTQPDGVYRFQKTRLPKDYLAKCQQQNIYSLSASKR